MWHTHTYIYIYKYMYILMYNICIYEFMYMYVYVYKLYICKNKDCFTNKNLWKKHFLTIFSCVVPKFHWLWGKKSKFQEVFLRYFVYVTFIPLVTKRL